VYVNSGSSANLLALAALELPKRSEVITCAVGFPTTVNPIIQLGLIPVFVDADKTYNIDVEQIERIEISGWAVGACRIVEPELDADPVASKIWVKAFEGPSEGYRHGGLSAENSPSYAWQLLDIRESNQGHANVREWTVRFFEYLESENYEIDLTTAHGLQNYASILHNVSDAWVSALAQDALDAAAKDAHAARERAKRYDALVEFFRDTLPRELLANAELPVEGLSVDADQILINGIPLHQLGTSQQIRVGVLIASRLNPASAFILVDGAESMGKKDRAELAKVAHELGLQLIMTIVDPDAVPAPGVTVMEAGAALATVAN
jgi:hypothetical protein